MPVLRRCRRAVKTDTVRSLIRKEKLGDIIEGGYFFCKTKECETVYFTEDGRTFSKGDLSVRVGTQGNFRPQADMLLFRPYHGRDS